MRRKTTDVKLEGGVGFLGLLTLLFITLKLTDVIGWSWWWVLAPSWGFVAVVLALLAIAAVLVSFDFEDLEGKK